MSSPRIRHPATPAAYRSAATAAAGSSASAAACSYRCWDSPTRLRVKASSARRQGQAVRVRALLGLVGRPAERGPEVVGHRVEPGPPVRRRLRLRASSAAVARHQRRCRDRVVVELAGARRAAPSRTGGWSPAPGTGCRPRTASPTSRLCSASRASPSATAPALQRREPGHLRGGFDGERRHEHRRPGAAAPDRRGSSRAWLQSSTARTERCRSSARGPPASSRSVSDRPAVRPSSPRVGNRAAASSIASAMPSSRRRPRRPGHVAPRLRASPPPRPGP